jgi:hypothetical protein
LQVEDLLEKRAPLQRRAAKRKKMEVNSPLLFFSLKGLTVTAFEGPEAGPYNKTQFP